MTITPGVCSLPGCGRVIRTDLLMCGRHWGRVPRDLQVDVTQAFRLYRAGNLGLDELRAVQCRATEAVAEKGGAA